MLRRLVAYLAPTPHAHGVLLVLVSVACFTTNVLLIRALGQFQHVNVWLVVCARFVVGLTLVAVFYRREFAPANLWRKPKLVLRGLAGGLSVAAFYFSIVHLGAGRATFINNTYVIFGALLAVGILHERFQPALATGSVATLVGLALLTMRLAAFGAMKDNVSKQFAIFRNKHTWSLTALYIVTFGSFIGFSMVLPLAITVIFGYQHVADAAGVMQHTLKNPNAPSALTYAWIGPFVGAAVRPVGGWISDKVGGSIVTQIISAVMVLASAAVGYVMMQAWASAAPEQYFAAFLGLFIVLFIASGIGNGSTFRTIGVIFDRQQAGPVLGWTSAVAAYGAFIAPVVIGAQIKAGTPQLAMYGFAIFYALCLVLNWWFYLRSGAEIKNP